MGKLYLVAGAGGFIAGHLIKRLLDEGNHVIAVDMKCHNDWFQFDRRAVNLDPIDIRNPDWAPAIKNPVYCVINLACDHGGIGYLINNDFRSLFDITINLNLLKWTIDNGVKHYLFASTACVYNANLQEDNSHDVYLKESDAWPALPDMKYGLEKLYGEELCMQAAKQHGINVYLPRIHGCYGPYNHFDDIKEKAPNALLRKALTSQDTLEVWGSGQQRRSFMYVSDAVDGICRLMKSDWHQPINLGSSRTVTMDSVAEIAIALSNRDLKIKHVDATVGVNSRSSDNTLIQSALGWEPGITIEQGLQLTQPWMENEIYNHTSR